MKKILCILSVFLLVGVVFAANTSNTAPANVYSAIPIDSAWPLGKTILRSGGTNTYREHIEYGQVNTNGVVYFQKQFVGTPAVLLTWNGVSSANAKNCTNSLVAYANPVCFTAECITAVATDLYWMAIGICTNN